MFVSNLFFRFKMSDIYPLQFTEIIYNNTQTTYSSIIENEEVETTTKTIAYPGKNIMFMFPIDKRMFFTKYITSKTKDFSVPVVQIYNKTSFPFVIHQFVPLNTLLNNGVFNAKIIFFKADFISKLFRLHPLFIETIE